MSIFPKFFFTLFGNALPSWLRLYIARVEGDGGTIVDRNHTKEVYDDVSDQIDYLLIANACDAGKLDVLYSFYVEEHPWYVDYIDRILDDGGTVERYAEVYNTYDDLESAGVAEDAFLWLSASSGKTGLLYRMGANTIVYDHEQRVAIDSGTTYLPGANARIVQQLVREDLYNDPSIIIPCASGKEGLLYSLLPAVELELLDYYTGSAAAYSLRSLSEYTTNVVKVRRSGDDAELDFTANEVSNSTLEAWVVAGGGTEDGFVTTWYDQSGNGNNATQTTAASQPKIVSSGTLVTENGKATVDFDGTDDYLSISNQIALADDSVILVVTKYDSGPAAGVLTVQENVSATFGMQLWIYTSKHVAYYGRTAAYAQIDSTLTTNQVVFVLSKSGSTGYLMQDNLSEQSIAYSSPDTSLKSYYIGTITSSQYRYNGNIQEIIIYDGNQFQNRSLIKSNINDYYNIYP